VSSRFTALGKFRTWKAALLCTLLKPFHLCTKGLFGGKLFEKKIPFLRKILLFNPGGLGDLFLSSSLISALQETFPGCVFGMLVTERTRAVAERCPGVEKVHLYRPWFRPGESKWRKLARLLHFSCGEKGRLARELACENYDCVLNTYPFFSGVGSLFFKTRIPTRVAFETVSETMLYSHLIDWRDGDYLPLQYQHLLKRLGLATTPFYSPWVARKKEAREEPYILFHPFSSEAPKDLPLPFWKELYAQYRSEGHTIYFTGKGQGQAAAIEEMAPPEHNLCDKLGWEELIDTIANAQLLICVDTVSVHIAAATNTPFLVLYRATDDRPLWYPKEAKGDYLEGDYTPKEAYEKGRQLLGETCVL
jgi:ADP-heptose:LPS heptosyltransferase